MRFDGEAGRVRKTESVISAAGTEEGNVTGDVQNIKDALEPTEDANYGGRDEKGENEGFPEGSRWVEEGGDVNNGEGGKKGEPEDAGSQDGAGGVCGPENGESSVEGEEGKEEEFSVRYTWQ